MYNIHTQNSQIVDKKLLQTKAWTGSGSFWRKNWNSKGKRQFTVSRLSSLSLRHLHSGIGHGDFVAFTGVQPNLAQGFLGDTCKRWWWIDREVVVEASTAPMATVAAMAAGVGRWRWRTATTTGAAWRWLGQTPLRKSLGRQRFSSLAQTKSRAFAWRKFAGDAGQFRWWQRRLQSRPFFFLLLARSSYEWPAPLYPSPPLLCFFLPLKFSDSPFLTSFCSPFQLQAVATAQISPLLFPPLVFLFLAVPEPL